MVKIKRTYKTSVFEDVEKLEPSHIAVGMQNGDNTLDNSLVIPQMVKYITILVVIYDPASISTPRYMHKRNEIICPHKNLYMNVHSSFVNNS